MSAPHDELLLPTPVLEEHRWRVLAVALAVGAASAWLAHPTLFDRQSAGVGLMVMFAAPLVAMLSGRAIFGTPPSRPAILFFWGALAMVPWLALRAAPGLIALDLAAAVALATVGLYRYQTDTPRVGVLDHLRIVCWAPFGVLVEPIRFLRDDMDGAGATVRQRSRYRAVAHGLALAVVPVLVFGTLLASADAAFSEIVGSLFGLDVGGMFEFVGVLAAVAWVIVGMLRFSAGRRPLIEIPRDIGYLGATEVVTVLGSLTAMFALFVGIQFAYLFGGGDYIRRTTELTTAEYYRQGFFQLVAVAALVALLVLVLDWWHRDPDRAPRRVVTALFEALVALTAVMVVSALVRLAVYMDSFGISRLRVYTAAFVVWIAVILVVLAVSVVRGRRDRFAPAAIVAAFAVVLALNLLNPDALIARVNIDRHLDTGAELDLEYLGTLSDDAVPAIVTRADGDLCPALTSVAIEIVGEANRGGFRAYNRAHDHADAAVTRIQRAAPC